MKKYFTHLLALVACLVCSVSANAQFSATIEIYPDATSYSNGTHEFSLSEVATTLGMDAATLVSTLDTWMENETPEEFLFQTSDYVPTELAGYTANDRGFWMRLDGSVVAYGGTEEDPNPQAMYSFFQWDAEAGTFTVGLGQMPGKLAAGDEGHVTLVVAIGDKKANFDMTLKIIEKPQADIPDPVTDLTALNIVGTKNITWDQYPNMPMNQTVDLTGVAEALGTTDEVIADNLSSFLFMTTLELKGETVDSRKPYKTNTISNVSTAGGIGFWMAAIWSDELEAFSEEVVRSFWDTDPNDPTPDDDPEKLKYAAFRAMYSEQYSYDAASHELTSVTGWESYALELGSKYNFDLYIVYGDKAYKLHHVITLTAEPQIDPTTLTEVGSEDISLSFEIAPTYYGGSFTLDVDAIAALLGCEPGNITCQGLKDGEGHMTTNSTANNGGWWLDAEGCVTPYASGFFYMEPDASGDYSSWSVGQYPNKATEPVTYTTKIFLCYDKSYYTINVTVNLTAAGSGGGVDPSDFVSVVEFTLIAQTEPQNSYDVDNYPAIDLDALESAIDTRAPTLYGWVKTEDGKTYSKSYTCTPYPGFWMDAEGYNVGWGNNSTVGASYLADGTFQLFQMPNANALGTVFKTDLFLVNEETGKMATVHLKLVFGEVSTYEEVGKKDITLIADPDTEHEVIVVDFTDAVQAMGVEDVTALLSGQCIAAITSDGTWSDPQIPNEGIAIDNNGYFNTSSTAFSIYASPGAVGNDVEFKLDNDGGIEITPDFNLPVRLAIQRDVEGNLRQYTLNVHIISLAAVGVADVKKSADNAVIYDLSGRRSEATRKGVYIQGGKKMVK